MLKKLKRIANILSRLFFRLAHVFEHLTCDDVPIIDLSDFDYGSIDPSRLDSDDDEEVV